MARIDIYRQNKNMPMTLRASTNVLMLLPKTYNRQGMSLSGDARDIARTDVRFIVTSPLLVALEH